MKQFPKALLPVVGALALLSPSARAVDDLPAPDYSDWYQVEIVVFANRSAIAGDESWGAEALGYPGDMVAIAGDTVRPWRLEQIPELEAMASEAQGASANDDAATQAAPDSGFLFEGRSRYSRNSALEQMRREAASGQSGASDSDAADGPSAEPLDLAALFANDLPAPFKAVPANALELDRIVGSINRSTRYRLLLHMAWRQPVPASDESWPILIQAGKRYDDLYEVDGTITVTRSRYLHADTNLWFTDFAQKYDQQAPLPEIVSELDPATLRKYPDLVNAARERGNYLAVGSYPMKISRRMRSGTLHYLDNPFFGVLIQVEPFDYKPGPAE